jgi:excisionase family DNA binding protein
MAAPDDTTWLTIEETCERWGISSVTLYKRIRQGIVTGVMRGSRLYFNAIEIDWLARFTMSTERAAKHIGIGWREFAYWADYSLVPALELDGRYLFAPEDVAVLRMLLKHKLIRITEATHLYGMSLHLLRDAVERGLLHALKFASYCYLAREELDDLALTNKGYTVKETAHRLGLSGAQVVYKARTDKLRYTRTPGGHRRFNEIDLRIYEAEQAKREAKKRTRGL